MLISYNANKTDRRDVTPYFETDDFAVVPQLCVNDGSVVASRLSVIQKRTGRMLFTAKAENLRYLQDVCAAMQVHFPLLARLQNNASGKKYLKRTREARMFRSFARKVKDQVQP